jgi:hypothetical protein
LILLSTNNSGVIGEYYDRIAADVTVISGNNRLAVYDDLSTEPNDILAETASIAVIGSFGWNNVTEFPLTTVRVWAGHQFDNATAALNFAAATTRASKSQAYGVFTTGGFTVGASNARHYKIGHS